MLVIYFTGTGNTQFASEFFAKELSNSEFAPFNFLNIEDAIKEKIQYEALRSLLSNAASFFIAYPIYGGTMPVPMRAFLDEHFDLFAGKPLIVLATQAGFSGDGGTLAYKQLKTRLTETKLPKPQLLSTIHLNMPVNLFAPSSPEQTAKIINKNKLQIAKLADKIKEKQAIRDGRAFYSWFLGFFFQRALFNLAERKISQSLKIDSARCIGCGQCIPLCPVGNLSLEPETGSKVPVSLNRCAVCHRCVNTCPTMAISLFGKTNKQYKGPIA